MPVCGLKFTDIWKGMVVAMKSIDEDIITGAFKQVYLFYGAEAYLKKQYKDKLKKALCGSDDQMNFTAYEGKNINPKEVIDLAETLPFFADRRVILIENSGFFKHSCELLFNRARIVI